MIPVAGSQHTIIENIYSYQNMDIISFLFTEPFPTVNRDSNVHYLCKKKLNCDWHHFKCIQNTIFQNCLKCYKTWGHHALCVVWNICSTAFGALVYACHILQLLPAFACTSLSAASQPSRKEIKRHLINFFVHFKVAWCFLLLNIFCPYRECDLSNLLICKTFPGHLIQ